MGQCRSSKAELPQIFSNGTGKYRLRRNSGFVLLEESATSANQKPGSLCVKKLKVEKRENSSSTLTLTENDDSKVIIKKSLLRSGVFTDQINQLHLTSHDIDRIVDAFHVEHYDEDQLLYQKDDFPSEKMYIVRSGIFRGLDNWVCKAIMRENDMIGELDFFHQNARHLSVSVLGSNASTYCLNKRDFKIIVERGRDLNNIRIFDSLSEVQKYSIKDQVKLSNYIRGTCFMKNALISHRILALAYAGSS